MVYLKLIAGLLFFILVVYLPFVVSKSDQVREGAKLPPGPKGIPLFGNIFDIPSSHSWLAFKRLADFYGPIFRLTVMGRNMVIVSSEKIANDLLRERGNLYSSREQLPMAAKLMSKNLRPLLLPYGDLWRRGRKLMHSLTMPAAATSYQHIQVYESVRLLHDIIQRPADYESLFERYAGAVIMRLAYGKTIETGDEPYVRSALKIVHTVERVASPGAYLVDTFPILMWLPLWLAPFKREAERLHQFELSLFRELLDEVRGRKDAPPCFAKHFVHKQHEYGLSDDEGAYVIGTLFEAGSGTTAAAMMSFCLAMCHYPDVQAHLQSEIESVVGDRPPEFADIPYLPLVRAVAKEVLRWRPVTAGGVPHELIKDDVYEGLFLPAGTNVHANQWAIHRDDALYPDAEVFNPQRWLLPGYPTYKEPLSKYPNLQNFSAFGFGRRICPGMNIAENSLYILVARLAWACTIRKRAGIDVPWNDYTAGFNTQPKPFVFDLEARPQKLQAIERLWAEATLNT